MKETVLDRMLGFIEDKTLDRDKYEQKALDAIKEFLCGKQDAAWVKQYIIPYPEDGFMRLYSQTFHRIGKSAQEENADYFPLLSRFLEVCSLVDRSIRWVALRSMAPLFPNLWEYFEKMGAGVEGMLEILCAHEIGSGNHDEYEPLEDALEQSLQCAPGGPIEREAGESARMAILRHICKSTPQSVQTYIDHGGLLQGLALLYRFGGREDLLPELLRAGACTAVHACYKSGEASMVQRIRRLACTIEPLDEGIQQALSKPRTKYQESRTQGVFCIAQKLLGFSCDPFNKLYTLLNRMYPRTLFLSLCQTETLFGETILTYAMPNGEGRRKEELSGEFEKVILEQFRQGRIDALSCGAAILCDVDLCLESRDEDQAYMQRVEDAFSLVEREFPGQVEEILSLDVDPVCYWGHMGYDPNTRELNLLYYARSLWRQDKSLQLVPAMERLYLNALLSRMVYSNWDNDIHSWDGRMMAYMGGGGKASVQEVKKMDIPLGGADLYYCAAGLLLGYSHIPRQLLVYTLAEKDACLSADILDTAYPYFDADILRLTRELIDIGLEYGELFLMYYTMMKLNNTYYYNDLACELGHLLEYDLSGTVDRYARPLDKQALQFYFDHIAEQEPQQVEKEIRQADNAKLLIFLLQQLYNKHPEWNTQLLLEMMEHKTKSVRVQAAELITRYPQLEAQVRERTGHKQKAVRECAEQVLKLWNKGMAGPRAGDSIENPVEYIQMLIKQVPPVATRQLQWLKEQELPQLHWASGALVDPEEIRAYVYSFYHDGPDAISEVMRHAFREEEMQQVIRGILDHWCKAGATIKTKNMLYMFAAHADSQLMIELKRMASDWGSGARAAMAGEAFMAFAYSDDPSVLPFMEGISMRHKSGQVQQAAAEALDAAAKRRGVSPEVLGELMIPTLGFNIHGEQTFSYGSRQFTACLGDDLSIGLQNQDGKVIKSLPTPGPKDDGELAQAERRRFGELKKQIKLAVEQQSARLELALATGRTWESGRWRELFIQNPLMQGFATGLIWGEYKDVELLSTFRYQNDQTFTTADEAEYILPANAAIGLVHPLELDEPLLACWKQQLEEYEVSQPIDQLERTVYRAQPGEQEQDKIMLLDDVPVQYVDGFARPVNVASVVLRNVMEKLGWARTPNQDGVQYGFWKDYRSQGIRAQLSTSGLSYGQDMYAPITLHGVSFLRLPANGNELKLTEVPPRLFSEICVDLKRITDKKV